MADFWRNSGYHLLERGADGYLRLTDDFLRAFLHRPELYPEEDSCPAELRLHASLLKTPMDTVHAQAVAAIRDPDTRENYQLFLRFRERLLDADSIEQCYATLFAADQPIDLPMLLVDHLVHAIARNLLDGVDDAYLLRAGELLFREQTVQDVGGAVLLTDADTVALARERNRTGQVSLLDMLHDPTAFAPAELDVLSQDNAAHYKARSNRFDFALDVTFGRDGLQALARVLERWVAHFLGVEVDIEPLERIDDEAWRWHVGLDAEATALLNDLYAGREVDEERRARLISLFRLTFRDAASMRADVAGRPVYLGLARSAGDGLRLKPQNLLVNLPVAAAA